MRPTTRSPGMSRGVRLTAGLAVVLLGAACSSATPGAPAPSTSGPGAPAPPTPVVGPVEPGPSSEVSTEPGLRPVPQATGPAAAPAPPAATAAGPLDQGAFPPEVLGFRSVPGVAAEGEYQPDGTWVHAVDAQAASLAALPPCGDTGASPPAPARHALAATYADAGGRPGNGLALEFADGPAAKAWLAAYTARLGACPAEGGAPVTVRGLQADPAGFSAHRHQAADGHDWTEAGRLREARVTLLILSGDVDAAALRSRLG